MLTDLILQVVDVEARKPATLAPEATLPCEQDAEEDCHGRRD
jgi:hypothetical protein